jgi:hypothetical protein
MPRDRRAYMRRYMRDKRAGWRAARCCPRCGDPLDGDERNCAGCRMVRTAKSGKPLATSDATGASSTLAI